MRSVFSKYNFETVFYNVYISASKQTKEKKPFFSKGVNGNVLRSEWLFGKKSSTGVINLFNKL